MIWERGGGPRARKGGTAAGSGGFAWLPDRAPGRGGGGGFGRARACCSVHVHLPACHPACPALKSTGPYRPSRAHSTDIRGRHRRHECARAVVGAAARGDAGPARGASARPRRRRRLARFRSRRYPSPHSSAGRPASAGVGPAPLAVHRGRLMPAAA